MSNKILNSWGRGCAWRALLQLLLPFLIFGALLACMVAVALVPLPRELRNQREFIFVGALAIAVFSLVGLAFAFGLWSVTMRARQLNAAFEPLGLKGRMFFANGRQYHGALSGRQVDAYFYRGPAFDLYVSAAVKTRLGIGTKDSVGAAISKSLNRIPFETGDPDLSRLNVFPADEHWTRGLLADSAAKAALLRLTADEGPYEIRNVIFYPGAIQLKLHRTSHKRITPEAARQWMDDLITLARVAESLPSPAKVEEESALEARTRANRDAFTLPALLFVFGLLGFLICLFSVIIGVILLIERG